MAFFVIIVTRKKQLLLNLFFDKMGCDEQMLSRFDNNDVGHDLLNFVQR